MTELTGLFILLTAMIVIMFSQRSEIKLLKKINRMQADDIEELLEEKPDYQDRYQEFLAGRENPEDRFYAASQVCTLIKALTYSDRMQLVRYEKIARDALAEMRMKEQQFEPQLN